MAKNDIVLVDGLIDERIANGLPSPDRAEAFEYFAIEQTLKDFDLSRDEILAGIVDGRDDGGIDGFYIFINGHLLVDTADFAWPRRAAEIAVWVVTCKHHDTFELAPVDKLTASLSELLDLSLREKELRGTYSAEILAARVRLKFAYKTLSSAIHDFRITVVYASRGDRAAIGEAVQARANQVAAIPARMFSRCSSEFRFIGAQELVTAHRRVRRFTLELPFQECMWRGDRFVLLSSIADYNRFVTDEQGRVMRHLLESNVRDALGDNSVNEDIMETLRNPGRSDFWWMNNGITILATKAMVADKCLLINDVQIVNGLQTTDAICRYYRSGASDTARAVLVKVIVSEDPQVRDEIIKATNNQTAVEHASLRATDKTQRDIEDVFTRHGMYYERRKNFHVNQGASASDIVTPLYLASGYVSLILKLPQRASRLKQKFMRSDISYPVIFSAQVPLEVWPRIARVMRAVDLALKRRRPAGHASSVGFMKAWRHPTALLAVGKAMGTFAFTGAQFARFDVGLLTTDAIEDAWAFIAKHQDPSELRLKRSFLKTLFESAANEWGTLAHQAVERGTLFSTHSAVPDELVENVDRALPSQPWKPGVHHVIAQQLRCSPSRVSAAIESLMASGKRFRQKDGVVFDASGHVVAFDPDRVDPANLPAEHPDD